MIKKPNTFRKNRMRIISLVLLILTSCCFCALTFDTEQNHDTLIVTMTPDSEGGYIEVYQSSMLIDRRLVLTEHIDTFFNICQTPVSINWVEMNKPGPSDVRIVGENIVEIPGGWYKIGADQYDIGELRTMLAPESFISIVTPYRWVFLDTFRIMTEEVSNEDFNTFMAMGGYSNDMYWSANGIDQRDANGWSAPSAATTNEDLPVKGISWYEAEAYCNYASGSIPSEVQWEIAARMNSGYIFPWGDIFCEDSILQSSNIIDRNQCVADTFSGGPGISSYFDGDMSQSGCYSMSGNVSEWCLDAFDTNYYEMVDTLNPGLSSGDVNTIRGGSFSTWQRYDASCLGRTGISCDSRQNTIGVRVAWNIGDGNISGWQSANLDIDCIPPEIISISKPPCINSETSNEILVAFSEPVTGNIDITPNYSSITVSWNANSDTAIVTIPAYILLSVDTFVILDFDNIEDEAGNALSHPADTSHVCNYEYSINIPDNICVPFGCSYVDSIEFVYNGSDILVIDSVRIDDPYEVLTLVSFVLEPGENFWVKYRFTAEGSGEISRDITVYTPQGIETGFIISHYTCDSIWFSFEPENITFTEEDLDEGISTKPAYLRYMSCTWCDFFTMKVCNARWAKGYHYSHDLIDETVVMPNDSMPVNIYFTPRVTDNDNYTDTLFVSLLPVKGECTDMTTVSIVVNSQGEYECTPVPECREPYTIRPCDTVMANEVIYFTNVCQSIFIYDKYGKYVIELEPNILNEAIWYLDNDDGDALKSGVYKWISGKKTGDIIIGR